MASRALIKESLEILNICGLNLNKQSIFTKLRAAFAVTIMSIACIDILFGFIVNWKGINGMEDLTVCVGFYQVITKALTVIVHREQIAEVLVNVEQFWPIEKYGSELQNEIETIHTTGRKSVKLFLIMVVLTTSVYVVQALLASVRKLAFASYLLVDADQSPGYELMFTLHIFALCAAVFSLIGSDFLFISLIINISCELKLVQKGFENVPINSEIREDNNESLTELYKMIDHHDLTLRTIKYLRGIYSLLLLNVFFFNMCCMCLGLFCIIITTGFPPSFQSVFKYGLYVVVYCFQLFFYCIAGSYLTTQSENVSTAIYNTNWWIQTQPQLRRAYVMVIGRANRVESLTAGGMFNLDLDSFARVTNTALSFFTVVKAMYRDE